MGLQRRAPIPASEVKGTSAPDTLCGMICWSCVFFTVQFLFKADSQVWSVGNGETRVL